MTEILDFYPLKVTITRQLVKLIPLYNKFKLLQSKFSLFEIKWTFLIWKQLFANKIWFQFFLILKMFAIEGYDLKRINLICKWVFLHNGHSKDIYKSIFLFSLIHNDKSLRDVLLELVSETKYSSNSSFLW